MAKRKASRARGTPAMGGRPGTAPGRTPAPGGTKAPVQPITTFGISPSFFAFRARDTRGMVIQLVSVAGLGVGLLVALDRQGGPTTIAGEEQITQFLLLVSIFGLLAVPLAVAALTDATLTWLGRRGDLSGTSLARAALVLPPILAFVAGGAVPIVLFGVGGQTLYLVVAGVVLVLVLGWSAAAYVQDRWQAGKGSGA